MVEEEKRRYDFDMIAELDALLTFFYDRRMYYSDMNAIYQMMQYRRFRDTPRTESITCINSCMNKLRKDGYIDEIKTKSDSTNKEATHWVISFDGVIFYQNGRYSNAERMRKRKIKIQNMKDWLMILGTWCAAAGLLWSLLKYLFHSFIKTNEFSIIVLLLFSMSLGALLAEAIRALMKRK